MNGTKPCRNCVAAAAAAVIRVHATEAGLRLPYVENEIRVLKLVLEFLLRNLLVVPQCDKHRLPDGTPVAYTHSLALYFAYSPRIEGCSRFGLKRFAVQSSL
jgi:hypothetical protein